MIDKAIVSVMCIIVFIAVVVTMTGIAADILKKIEFDNMCRAALYEIDLNGGMTTEIFENLNGKLNDKNFYEIEIIGDSMIQYGETINFSVTAKSDSLLGNISYFNSEREIVFAYEKEFVSRKIHNLADPQR